MLTGTPWGKEEVARLAEFNFLPAVETYLDKEARSMFRKSRRPESIRSMPGI
jgi:hypothetical protein